MKNNQTDQELENSADERLVAVFQARGPSSVHAYNVLINRHQAALFRRCHGRLGNRNDAEEAVQETLLRVFRGLRRFRGDAEFRTWLFSIADNQCNTCHVRRSRHLLSEHVRALIALHEEASDDELPGADTGRVAQVRDALSDLPSQARDVLMLRFYSDLSLTDMANTLGIGLSATKMRLYRALGQFEAAFSQSAPQRSA